MTTNAATDVNANANAARQLHGCSSEFAFSREIFDALVLGTVRHGKEFESDVCQAEIVKTINH